METACYKTLSSGVFDEVYEPAEDSFILLDALENELDFLKHHLRPKICLEIGSGSGIVISSVAKALGSSTTYMSTDINPHAVRATELTAENNKVTVEVVQTDMVNAISKKIQNSVDLLLWNPPYAVTPTEEIEGDNLQVATAGGARGREVMDRLFPLLPSILSPRGVFFLVCIKENVPNDIIHTLSSKYGLKGKEVLSRKCGIEHLFVLRFSYCDYS